MKILTAEAMREVDRMAIEDYGIPSLVLMENAAIGVADAIAERFPRAAAVLIVCGPGNNGGDGLALARHLDIRGYRVRVVLAAAGREPAGDAGLQLAICRRQGLSIEEAGGREAPAALVERHRDCDLVVDALFGTGLKRALEGEFAALVEAINRLPAPRVAVDLPSGLSGSTAAVPGPCVGADLTVTFAAPKLPHVFPPAAESVGEVVVTDLGIPRELVARAASDLELLEAEELAPALAPRRRGGHKGDYGHVLVVAGSPGKAGAAVLTARGAVRSGAGLVTVAVPETVLGVVDAASVESMSQPLPVTGAGALADEAVAAVLAAVEGKDALALGPGLGQLPDTAAAIRRIALETDLPLVLDADGLNAFGGALASLAERRGETVLTPHPGELARLLGVSTAEVVGDRVGAARRAAELAGAIVALKGHRTLVADPLGGVAVNPTGNPGMATGGSGDVLTGMIAALAGQGMGAALAARLGVYLHGLAGDLAARERGEISLSAGDLVERLPAAFERLASR